MEQHEPLQDDIFLHCFQDEYGRLIMRASFVVDGLLENPGDDLAAVTEWDTVTGQLTRYEFRASGFLHKEDGPAVVAESGVEYHIEGVERQP